MNHWHTLDQLAAGRRADLGREAAGGTRMRAAALATEPRADRTGRWNLDVLALAGRRLLRELRSNLALPVGRDSRDVRLRPR